MKHARKLISLLLALAMVFALALPVLADGEDTDESENVTSTKYTIIIENSVKGYEYKAYQIFKGDFSKESLANIKWGSGINADGQSELLLFDGTQYNTVFALAKKLDSGNVEIFAAEAAKYLDDDKAISSVYSDDKSQYTISGLDSGYYLVKNTDVPNNEENAFYSDYILKVVNNVTVTPKGDVPKVEKKIVESSEVDDNAVSIGDPINYKITGTLPYNIDDYKEYYYVFTDTLSKGLTYEDDIEIYVENPPANDGEESSSVKVTDYFYKNSEISSTTSETTITVGIQDLLALGNLDAVTITKDSKIVIKYSATLNENAVIGGTGNPNKVKLTYSNDPNNSGSGTKNPPPKNPDEPEPTAPSTVGETPEDEVVTYTTELTILKTDENGEILTGAEFTLTGEAMNVVLVSTATNFELDDKGTYWKLKNNTYTETAPSKIYDSLDTKYSYNSDTGVYTEDQDGAYWKLANGEYTETAPNNMYDDLDKKYSKVITTTAKGTGKDSVTVVGAVDSSSGEVTFQGLGPGTYTITESNTPDGYNTIAPIDFTITFGAPQGNEASVTFGVKDITAGNTITVSGNKLSTTIVNKSGSTLPSTGGMGTALFYIVGGILVVGAAVLLITKRRMENEEK